MKYANYFWFLRWRDYQVFQPVDRTGCVERTIRWDQDREHPRGEIRTITIYSEEPENQKYSVCKHHPDISIVITTGILTTCTSRSWLYIRQLSIFILFCYYLMLFTATFSQKTKPHPCYINEAVMHILASRVLYRAYGTRLSKGGSTSWFKPSSHYMSPDPCSIPWIYCL